MTKLWQKDSNVKEEVERFTVGNDRQLDLFLAEHDVMGSMAHTVMLEQIGLLTKDELKKIHRELTGILADIRKGKFEIEPNVEDVHSQIELMLTRKIGDAGKKIHSGRSRNDQVLVDIKLFLRAEIKTTVEYIEQLFNTLISLSEKHKNKLLPGYTHLQVAMPSSFGLWFGAYAESLIDDMEMVLAAYNVANKNPLGSGAGYGSSFPLKRITTTKLLEFESMNHNVVYAQMTRGKSEKVTAMALACIAATLAKLAMDVCLYMGQDMNFISFPDELTTGSSIMPHKKNPDVFELIRGKCNKLQALPNELALLTTNLPSGYHRDMQLTKQSIIPAFTELNNCIVMADFMLKQIKVRDNILKDEKYKYVFSVEKVNEEVLKGTPFRDAYKKVGKEISAGKFKAPSKINHTHEGSIGNLCNDEIKKAFLKILNKIK